MKSILYWGSIFFLSALIIVKTTLAAEPVGFTWDANTEADLAGYKLYQRDAAVAEFTPVDMPMVAAGIQTATITLENGSYCWVITALNTAGKESGYSNEVCTEINTAPDAPKNFQIVITVGNNFSISITPAGN